MVTGDDRSFSKWLPSLTFYFGHTVLITAFYVGLWHKMYMCLYQYISVFELKQGPKLREIVLAPFRKQNSFNNSRKYVKFGIVLVDSCTLELANVSQLFTFTWKYYLTQWSPNIIQWFMYEAIVRYVVQGLEWIEQRRNPICATFHIFFQIIKGIPFPERSKYHFSQFWLSLKCLIHWYSHNMYLLCHLST